MVQIPLWRERNQTYPSFTWAQFIDSVRSKVNPLASDSHIQLLVQQLQLIGEVWCPLYIIFVIVLHLLLFDVVAIFFFLGIRLLLLFLCM